MKSEELKAVALEDMFSKPELKQRKEHIRTLRHFGSSGLEAAKALAEVRDKKLYKPHASLREFCERECGWTKGRMNQILNFLKVRKSLPDKMATTVVTERAARALSRVPEEHRVEVLEAIGTEEVTSNKIEAAAKVVAASQNGMVDEMGYPIPSGDSSYFWSRKVEIENILDDLEKVKRQVNRVRTDDALWTVIHPNGVIHDLESAISRIKGGMPAYVCAYCEGVTPKECKVCKGVGLVSRFIWKNTPQEKVDARAKAIKTTD